MKRLTILSVILLTVSAIFANAQTKYQQVYSVTWNTYQPIGTTSDFISQYSLNGLDLSYTYYFSNNMGVGLDIAWNFNNKAIAPQVIKPNDNIAIYAAQFRQVQTVPVKAQFKYMITPESPVRLYVAAGIGALNYAYQTEVQEFVLWDNTWGFLVSPEVGMLVPFGRDAQWGLNLHVGYNYGTNDFQNVYANVGLFFAVPTYNVKIKNL